MSKHHGSGLHQLLCANDVERDLLQGIFGRAMISAEQLTAGLQSEMTLVSARAAATSLMKGISFSEKIEILDELLLGRGRNEECRQAILAVFARDGLSEALSESELLADAIAPVILSYWKHIAKELDPLTQAGPALLISTNDGPDGTWRDGTSPTPEGRLFKDEAGALGSDGGFYHARVGDYWYDSTQVPTEIGDFYLFKKTMVTNTAEKAD